MRCLAALLALAPLQAAADFIDTTRTVTAFDGAAWTSVVERLLRRTPVFQGGYAEGAVLTRSGGRSATSLDFPSEAFAANPAFADSRAASPGVGPADGAATVFGHRSTCPWRDGGSFAVLTPVVTSDLRTQAWMPRDGGVVTVAAGASPGPRP